jgi:hypothetical protein
MQGESHPKTWSSHRNDILQRGTPKHVINSFLEIKITKLKDGLVKLKCWVTRMHLI